MGVTCQRGERARDGKFEGGPLPDPRVLPPLMDQHRVEKQNIAKGGTERGRSQKVSGAVVSRQRPARRKGAPTPRTPLRRMCSVHSVVRGAVSPGRGQTGMESPQVDPDQEKTQIRGISNGGGQ